MQLTQDSITKAAISILDEYGLADMTMRRLAKRLSVAPGAIYWHFANKQALIANISRTILAPVLDETNEDAEAGASTPATPAELCALIRASMLAHRDGAELVGAALSQSGLRESLEDHITASLVAHTTASESADPQRLRDGATTLLHFVMGATMTEQSALQLLEATQPGAEAASEPSRTPEKNFQTTFENGIEIILRGLGPTTSTATL